MWDLWTEEEIASPYAELMTYQSEVNNGGHGQYFTNVENTSDLAKEMSALEKILPAQLKANLRDAYRACLILEEKEDDPQAEEALERCDNVFWEQEEEINRILEEHASRLEL